MANKVV